MSRSLSASLKTAKNLLQGSDGWLVLFEIQVTTIERLYLVNNEEEITFAGQIYRPFPVGFEVMEETSTGDLPVVNLVVGNVSREIQGFMEHRNGLLDCPVIMRIVHTSDLEDSASVLTNTFTVRASSISEEGGSRDLDAGSHSKALSVDGNPLVPPRTLQLVTSLSMVQTDAPTRGVCTQQLEALRFIPVDTGGSQGFPGGGSE